MYKSLHVCMYVCMYVYVCSVRQALGAKVSFTLGGCTALNVLMCLLHIYVPSYALHDIVAQGLVVA